ncbi:Taurine catabolism dioxygenase TauD, TfdA, variant 2 [Parelaphostrongylus tenuis]|uniref:Trimethyllysine dioxygenase, mitochondrial n=1 Tax=Parelaphostrongylus tenuis TaxID=148309 RepID=A0AAD5WH55_PARTN|nr:Taurine catabolism dioxygenase TauD, TfdA, variant 2 [Parelaphostrongylus tenuis]
MDISQFSMRTFAELFVKYGMVIVNGIEANPHATEEFCRTLAPIHDTFFGSFWVFSNKAQEKGEEYHEDTAYGNEFIGPHTDGTYFQQTPGIQVFHCLHAAEQGGDTVLVDSLYCAIQLQKENPEAFRILTEQKIDHHYIEVANKDTELHSLSKEKTVIELDSYGNIVQIRFNPYDRAPFRILRKGEDTAYYAVKALQFYHAYTAFSRICHQPENSTTISLRPETVIFIDNFRILHSRTAFTGWRQMCGCYLSRDNFMAKARPLFPAEIRRFI